MAMRRLRMQTESDKGRMGPLWLQRWEGTCAQADHRQQCHLSHCHCRIEYLRDRWEVAEQIILSHDLCSLQEVGN